VKRVIYSTVLRISYFLLFITVFYSAALETNLYTATDAAETDDKLYKLRDETTRRTELESETRKCNSNNWIYANTNSRTASSLSTCPATTVSWVIHSSSSSRRQHNRPQCTVQCQLDRPSTDCGPATHPPLHPGTEPGRPPTSQTQPSWPTSVHNESAVTFTSHSSDVGHAMRLNYCNSLKKVFWVKSWKNGKFKQESCAIAKMTAQCALYK